MKGSYSNIISPSLEVINRFNEWCRESRKPEKEGGDLYISFLAAEMGLAYKDDKSSET